MEKISIGNLAFSLPQLPKINGRSRRQKRKPQRNKLDEVIVEVIFDDDQGVTFDCFDLSSVGVYLYSDILLAEGEPVTLRLSLPGVENYFYIEGQVVRSNMGDQHCESGMGVAFKNVDFEVKNELQKFVAQRFFRHAKAR